jgi:hypothetical protein
VVAGTGAGLVVTGEGGAVAQPARAAISGAWKAQKGEAEERTEQRRRT